LAASPRGEDFIPKNTPEQVCSLGTCANAYDEKVPEAIAEYTVKGEA
jgi:hypothetical protein